MHTHSYTEDQDQHCDIQEGGLQETMGDNSIVHDKTYDRLQKDQKYAILRTWMQRKYLQR